MKVCPECWEDTVHAGNCTHIGEAINDQWVWVLVMIGHEWKNVLGVYSTADKANEAADKYRHDEHMTLIEKVKVR